MADKPTTKLSEVKAKTQLPEGTFLNKAETIKKTILKYARDKTSAQRMIQFYINRAGKNLANKREVLKAQKLIENCRDFSLLTKRLQAINFSELSHLQYNVDGEYDKIENIVKGIIKENDLDNERKAKLSFGSIEKDKYGTDTIKIYGGLNGCGDWVIYFNTFTELLATLNEGTPYDVWVIDLDVDCPDDIFTLTLGICKKRNSSDETFYWTPNYLWIIKNIEPVNKEFIPDITDGEYPCKFYGYTLKFPNGREIKTTYGVRCMENACGGWINDVIVHKGNAYIIRQLNKLEPNLNWYDYEQVGDYLTNHDIK